MIRLFEGFDASTEPKRRLSPHDLKLYRQPHLDEEARRRIMMLLSCGTTMKPQEPFWARCPLCNVKIGDQDRALGDYVWVDGAEHYIEAHNLVPPAVERFLEAMTPKG
jgi:hypothetical protein